MCWDGLISLSECQTSVSYRLFKKAVQQDSSECSGEAYASVGRVAERCENVAGEIFSRLLEAFFAGRAAKDLNELGQPSDLHGVVGLGVNGQEVFEHA